MEAVGNTVLKAFIALTSKSSIITAGERFNPIVVLKNHTLPSLI